jgi:copper(I)-binding protein
LLAAAPARAAEPGVSLQGGWMRMLIPSRPAGGYFTLTNSGALDRTLTGAGSPVCGSVMLHESEHDGSTERMVMVTRVKVPAHAVLHFAPGGYHLMCMHPGAAMRAGARVPVTLRFADGGSLSASFVVKGALDR